MTGLISELVALRAVEMRRQLNQVVAAPVPEPSKAQLDAVSLFRYGALFDDLPRDD